MNKNGESDENGESNTTNNSKKSGKKCDCTVCQICAINFQFSLDVECSKFFLSKCSSDSFRKVIERYFFEFLIINAILNYK